MTKSLTMRTLTLTVVLAALSACAGTDTLVASPTVNLTGVKLEEVSFSKQTFLLAFDVSNPNPFPLPVRMVRYDLAFDDERFAGGETEGSFTVPARGADAFVISVDLDVLSTAKQLSSMLRGGVPEQVNYALEGSLTVDIPFTRPIPFSSSGVIHIQDWRADGKL
jgi:LEA14-like dessication related protein